MPEPRQYTAHKAWAAGGGGAIGPALAQIAVILMPRLEPAETALSIVLGAVLAAGSAYFATNRPKPR